MLNAQIKVSYRVAVTFVQRVPLFSVHEKNYWRKLNAVLSLLRGTEYDYPRQHVNSIDKCRATVPAYQYHIYGEKEGVVTKFLL